jgi:cellulose synthase/poly-beta-1,6-N-acetylglucosamine synthase-like glycosyltransferase
VEEAVLKDHDRTAVRVSTVPQAGAAQGALLRSGTLPRLCTKTQDISLRAECRSMNDEFNVLQMITCSCLACTIFPYFSIFLPAVHSPLALSSYIPSLSRQLYASILFSTGLFISGVPFSIYSDLLFPMTFSVHVWLKSSMEQENKNARISYPILSFSLLHAYC